MSGLRDAVAPLTLVVGPEEFLISRALEDLRARISSDVPDVESYESEAGGLDLVQVVQFLSPSLFGGHRHVVIRSAQDLPTDAVATLLPMLLHPEPDTTVVVQHLGAAKGKAVLDAVRKAGAVEMACAPLTRPDDRQQFVRAEVRRFAGQITPGAVTSLLDAVGSDLREISAAASQLVGDSGGDIDERAVREYHRGRAEVSGFAVADQAVAGRLGQALTDLRWALNSGVPPVVIADALADGVRSVARVVGAGPGDPFVLAPKLGMPPWKLKRARTQSRGWSEDGLRSALAVVAQLNANVKGAAIDPLYALEAAVRSIAAVREAPRGGRLPR